MSEKEILGYLELIRHELTDAYHTTPTDLDAFYSVDTARDLVDELTANLKNESGDCNEEVTLDEVMNTSPTLTKLL
jgi:hypothetical protein|tara:strand:+ start:68 stop:295 length:228 start_codon:yes stop_codon:yes gene_type:complete